MTTNPQIIARLKELPVPKFPPDKFLLFNFLLFQLLIGLAYLLLFFFSFAKLRNEEIILSFKGNLFGERKTCP